MSKPRLASLAMLAVAAIFLSEASTRAASQTFTTLHAFGGLADGGNPFGGLIADHKGNFYGTTQFGGEYLQGTVFELSPPAQSGGTWTNTILWNFAGNADGAQPSFQLAMDGRENLYGETEAGGDPVCLCGTVFVLLPPQTSGGSWTKRVAYKAPGPPPSYLYGGVILDSSGAIYGIQEAGGTSNAGLAFKLTPRTSGGFTAATLYEFGANGTDTVQPYGPLTMDSSGNLYGVSNLGGDSNLGTVFRLTPPATGTGPWTNTVLYSFAGGNSGCTPEGNLMLDTVGRLYGTATACGAQSHGLVFRLAPGQSGAPWVESVLHAFSSTEGGGLYPSVSLNTKTATLYGTSFYSGSVNAGVVFQLRPPAGGVGPWTETVLHSFTNGADGNGPLGPLIWDSNGLLYGTEYFFALGNYGSVFSITP
jgi:uncharacterized repeat protein (TIGR03803 family)